MPQMLIEAQGSPTLGLALGGGGARGFAHILVLEALDELGLKPALIAGTSIGAIIGAAYASGMTGQEIRWYCEELFANRTGLMRRMVEKWPGSLTDIWNPFSPALFNVETVLDMVLPERVARDFESLAIPLIVITTDFHEQAQRELASGPLRPAIAASAALPALLKPMVIDGHVLIDGGFVNPVPYEQLKGRTDISLAIDVNGEPRGDGESIPNSVEQLIGMSQIVTRSILREKLVSHRPDILISPPVGRFRVLEFFKFKDVLAQCVGLKDEVKQQLHARLEQRI